MMAKIKVKAVMIMNTTFPLTMIEQMIFYFPIERMITIAVVIKEEAASNDGPFDNRNTYILKSCHGGKAFSLIRFIAAQGCASLKTINTEKCRSTKPTIQILILYDFPIVSLSFSNGFLETIRIKKGIKV